MINEAELNAIKGLMHYLNDKLSDSADLSFDVKAIDSNGDVLVRLERIDNEYQLLFGAPS